MEINGGHFPKDISQSAILLEMMHGLGESIYLSDKYYEHTEKKVIFRGSFLQVKKIVIHTLILRRYVRVQQVGRPGRTNI